MHIKLLLVVPSICNGLVPDVVEPKSLVAVFLVAPNSTETQTKCIGLPVSF